MSVTLTRRFGTGAALAMIIAEVMGVGIFLTPAGMVRTLGNATWVLGVWALIGVLSVAGALCYAELGSRFPEAGGGFVFLREAFGERTAFVYGWMSLLVMDPGLTAALAVGLAQYVLALFGASPSLVPAVAIGSILVMSAVSMLGVENSARILRWTAAAKLAVVGVLVLAVLVRADAGGAPTAVGSVGATPSFEVLGGALMGAFFAFGGWWDLGKMSEEIVEPRRTLPTALVGGIVVVTLVYAGLSIAFMRVLHGAAPATDDAFVVALGSALFGGAAGRFLAAAVVIAVAGSLAAILLGAPRVYLAMARSGVFPASLVRFHPTRQSAPLATLVQVVLACVLVMLGTFDQIIGYFVPAVVFFLGLSAGAIFVVPRTRDDDVFCAPGHPIPIIVFLILVAVIVTLFAVARPMQTLTSAVVIALGIPVGWIIARRRELIQSRSHQVSPRLD